MTTTLGAAAGCLGTAAIGFVEKQYIDPGYVYNGVLAGLVSITSPCAVVSPFGAIVVGLIGSLVYVGASKGVKAAGIDDAVDAFAVHGACGAWGVIACGLFATPFYYSVSYYGDRKDDCAGLFYGGKASGSFAAAFACVFVILAWVGSTMGALFGTLKATGLLRVSQEIEDAGLDDSKHGGAMSEVVAASCVEIKISRRVRTEASRRPPRHRRDACSMAWRCGSLTARRSHASDSLFDFHTGRERRRRQGHGGLDVDGPVRPAAVLSFCTYSHRPPLCLYCRRARTPRPVRAAPPRREHPAHTSTTPLSQLAPDPTPIALSPPRQSKPSRRLPARPQRRAPSQIPPSHSKPVARQCI